VFINDAQVISADNEASNGVVHIIDHVLIPYHAQLTCIPAEMTAPAEDNIVQLAESVPTLSTLVKALVAGKLVTTLESAGPFTVFAPTDDAFARIPSSVLSCLLADIKQLDTLLTYHVVAGNIQSKDLHDGETAKTVEGDDVIVHIHNGKVFIDGAMVTSADNEASNGVVHIIDHVLIPYNAQLSCIPGLTRSSLRGF